VLATTHIARDQAVDSECCYVGRAFESPHPSRSGPINTLVNPYWTDIEQTYRGKILSAQRHILSSQHSRVLHRPIRKHQTATTLEHNRQLVLANTRRLQIGVHRAHGLWVGIAVDYDYKRKSISWLVGIDGELETNTDS
jgi:hypothetical protein